MLKEEKLASQNAETPKETTKVNKDNLKDEIMKEEEKAVNSATTDESDTNIKIQEDSANKEQPITSIEEEDGNYSKEETIQTGRTWKAIINGEEQNIIIAFTDYNMELPKKKEDLFKLVNKDNLLPVMYNLADPNIFWKENCTLKDCDGKVIIKGTPNVYVLCPEPETNCRIFFDEELVEVSIHTFDSVQEWAKAVGTTNQLSLSFNKVKEVGIAAEATGEKAAKEVFAFAKKNKVNNTIAEIFLDTRLTPQAVSKMMLGHKPKMELTLGRTPEEAQEIYDKCCLTFGEGETKKRYVGRAVSSILKQEKFSYELVMEALRTIPASDIAYAKLMDCGTKEACIVGTLISWMIDMQRQQSEKKAA